MTAVGGFVDISELVFAAQAGSNFGYALIWVFAFATVGIMVFGEMCGRVAAVAHQPVFNLMRHRLGLKLGFVTLIASVISTLITTSAEIGGLGLVLHYLTGAPYLLMAAASVVVLGASMSETVPRASVAISRATAPRCVGRCLQPLNDKRLLPTERGHASCDDEPGIEARPTQC